MSEERFGAPFALWHIMSVAEAVVLRWAGIGVHVFTSLGSVCALFATLAVLDRAYELVFVWLSVALVIDAVDGAMARAVDIETHVPRFSGERLDLVIDYLTYVFVPVLALLRAEILAGWLGHLVAGLILLSSLYHFADTDSKADDNCFVGFPAVWNIVAFCLFAWGTPPLAAAMISLVLVALAFVPMHWIHPMRVGQFFVPSLVVTGAGLLAGVWILLTGFPGALVPASVLAVASLYFIVMAGGWTWLARKRAAGA